MTKKVRNKGKDVLWDYYQTNKKYAKENEEAYKAQEEEKGKASANGKKNPWTATEKGFLGVIILGGIAIAVKYLVF